MHSIAKPILIIAGIIIALYATAVLFLNIFLQSGGVQSKLRQAVARAAGIEPVISQTYYTPWSGLTVSGIKIPQAGDAKKPLLAVRSMKCQVSLSSLLRGQVVIKDITFEQPSLLLVQGQSALWPSSDAMPSHHRDKKQIPTGQQTGQSAAPQTATSPLPPSLDATPPAPSAPVAKEEQKATAGKPIVFENVRILDGQAAFYPAQGGRAIRLDGLSVDGKVSPEGVAEGSFRIKSAALFESVRQRDITGHFEYQDGDLKITNLKAAWAEGTVTGEFEITNAPTPFFTASLTAENVAIQKLAEEAGFTAEGTKGLLFAKANLQGIPGQPESFTGEASANLVEACMQPIDPLRQLGELLRINELRMLELRNARTALSIRDGKILVDRVEVETANLLMDASGEARFDGTLDLDARFHVTQKLLKESLGFMGSKFQTSDREGYAHMPFSITGTLSRPKSDLLDKLVGVRIGEDVGGLLKNLLRMPKKEKKKKENQPAATSSPTN
ncbi:MAG: AsmA family protein [Spartobacteria bacterium]